MGYIEPPKRIPLLLRLGIWAADERLLKLVRMQVSFMASCPFCIDMNSFEYGKLGIDDREIEALQGLRPIGKKFSRLFLPESSLLSSVPWLRLITGPA